MGRAESGAAASTSSGDHTLHVSGRARRAGRHIRGGQSCTSRRAAPPRRMVCVLRRSFWSISRRCSARYSHETASLVTADIPCTGQTLSGPSQLLQEEAFVELSEDDLGSGDAFAELIGMAIEVEPSLAERATRDLSASQRASASVAGVTWRYPSPCALCC